MRDTRVLKGLTQEGLALDAGLDRTYMGGIERGERNVSVLNLCKVAKALGVSPAALLEDVEPE